MTRSARAPLRIDLAGGWTDVPAYADEDGGAVVNVTINKYVRGTLADDGSLSYERDVQASGLGSSACEHVLAEALRDPEADLDDIAERAFAAEAAEGVIGGRQDQYAACYGGLNFMTFSKPRLATGPVRIERLGMPEAHLAALEKRLVLVDSGIARLSGEIHEAVWAAYARHEDEVTGALVALQGLAKAMRDAIVGSDFGGIKQVIDENWRQQQRLHPSVTNDEVDAIFALAMRKGASAGKACGAGGGGALVFYASSDADGVALRQHLRGEGLAVINFGFTSDGLEDLPAE
jgi:D-glycero-alpha-D-manno-heptose-7-phosphate kinase